MTTIKTRAAKAATLTASNVKAGKAPLTAKVKQPSKAELQRNKTAKLNATASKSAKAIADIDATLVAFVTKLGNEIATAREIAAFYNALWATEMAQRRMHWTATHRSANASVEGSNSFPYWQEIEALRLKLQELSLANPKIDFASRNAAWSRITKSALEQSEYAGREPAPAKSTKEKVLPILIKAYRTIMNEPDQTPFDMEQAAKIGDLLRHDFKYDLSKINTKN